MLLVAVLAVGLSTVPAMGAGADDHASRVREREARFLGDRIDWWKRAGYPQVHLEGREWKFDEIEPCWAGAHAALLLKRSPEEIEEANRFFARAPVDWECDPDMRICELLHSYYAFKDDPSFTKEAREHLLSVFRLKEAPRRLNPTVWRFGATENHRMMGHVWRLLVSQIGGDKAETDAVGAHIADCITEHARKGWQEYLSPCYAEKEVGCMVLLRDWAADARLRKLADLMLDLLLAEQAVLNLDGMTGGPCLRAYGLELIPEDGEVNHNNRRDRMRSGLYSTAYIAFGDAKPHFYGVLGSMCLASSGYIPPEIITRLATDREARGCYEYKSHKPGKGLTSFLRSDREKPVDSDFNTRPYCWVTPDYILGASQEAVGRYGMADARGTSMFNALVVRGSARKTIFLDCGTEPPDIFQHKNVLVGRNSLGEAYVGEFAKPIAADGWLFIKDDHAFIALRPARGGWKWRKAKSPTVFGDYLDFEDRASPFVLEVARPSDYGGDFGAFRSDILDNRLAATPSGGLTYESCSRGKSGPSAEAFTVELLPGDLPKVDGKPVDLESYPALGSPYVNSSWDSGIVTISYESKSLTLDFAKAERR